MVTKDKTRQMDSDNLFIDFISEKAMQFDRFSEDQKPTAQDQLLDYAKFPNEKVRTSAYTLNDDRKIKDDIQKIMEEYAAPKARGKRDQYSKYEEDIKGEALTEPKKELGS